jgi:hypothetical protein
MIKDQGRVRNGSAFFIFHSPFQPIIFNPQMLFQLKIRRCYSQPPFHLFLPVLFIETFSLISEDFNPKPTKNWGNCQESLQL